MATFNNIPRTVDGLRLRHIMGRDEWSIPTPYGPDGWCMRHQNGDCSIIVTVASIPLNVSIQLAGVEIIHASMTRPDTCPSYEDLCRLHFAVWGENGYCYQVFVPREKHVNIHPYALHLWGRVDGEPLIPEFSNLALSVFGIRTI